MCMCTCVLVGSSKLYVSFAEYRLFYRALLPKRPIILRSLLLVATACLDMASQLISQASSTARKPSQLHIRKRVYESFNLCSHFREQDASQKGYLDMASIIKHNAQTPKKHFHQLFSRVHAAHTHMYIQTHTYTHTRMHTRTHKNTPKILPSVFLKDRRHAKR